MPTASKRATKMRTNRQQQRDEVVQAALSHFADGEYEENGVRVQKFKPGYARGYHPQRNARGGKE